MTVEVDISPSSRFIQRLVGSVLRHAKGGVSEPHLLLVQTVVRSGWLCRPLYEQRTSPQVDVLHPLHCGSSSMHRVKLSVSMVMTVPLLSGQ